MAAVHDGAGLDVSIVCLYCILGLHIVCNGSMITSHATAASSRQPCQPCQPHKPYQPYWPCQPCLTQFLCLLAWQVPGRMAILAHLTVRVRPLQAWRALAADGRTWLVWCCSATRFRTPFFGSFAPDRVSVTAQCQGILALGSGSVSCSSSPGGLVGLRGCPDGGQTGYAGGLETHLTG